MESNSIPDFAIVQNSRTKVSGVWTGKTWVEADASEYKILRLMSDLIRTAPDPVSVVKMVQKENPDWKN
jgi:hypothetical protein